MTANRMIRVMLADDHAVLRAGLRAVLEAEPDIEVVGEAGNGEEAVALAERLRPDVVLMDITMPVMDGLAATRKITEELPGVHIVALTMHTEQDYLFRVLDAGGSGYVLKDSAETDVLRAIRVAAAGEVFLYPSSTALLLAAYRTGERPQPDEEALTEQETSILRLTALGHSNTEIAKQVYLSPKTVDTYRSRIMHKLGLTHRTELVRYALDRGLLTPTASSGRERPAE